MSLTATAFDSQAAIKPAAAIGDTRRVLLHEQSKTRLQLGDDTARCLGETPWLSVATDREPGWWQVSTRQWVGAFTAGDLRIIMRPKIKPENLFLLLEVGLGYEAWQAEAIDYATNDELLASLVSFFARTAETTLARGLFHHYRHEDDDLLTLRGRIDFVRQFRRGDVLVPMACSWDEFTADVDENRCLKTAIRLALRVSEIPHHVRRQLRRLLAALDGVAAPTTQAALDRLNRIRFTRLNEHYRPALRLARLILANCTLQDQHGDAAASAFMLDMNKLFEEFVTSRLQRALRGRLDVKPQSRPYLDIDKRVQIRPDLTFRYSGETIGVADLKYKLADATADDTTGALARHGDYYQLLAYTTALKLKEGTLIYCADVSGDNAVGRQVSSDSLAKSTITVQHVGKRLHAVAIDLSGGIRDIEAQISALASHLVETTGTSDS